MFVFGGGCVFRMIGRVIFLAWRLFIKLRNGKIIYQAISGKFLKDAQEQGLSTSSTSVPPIFNERAETYTCRHEDTQEQCLQLGPLKYRQNI